MNNDIEYLKIDNWYKWRSHDEHDTDEIFIKVCEAKTVADLKLKRVKSVGYINGEFFDDRDTNQHWGYLDDISDWAPITFEEVKLALLKHYINIDHTINMKTDKTELQELANLVMSINHVQLQCDDIHAHEHKEMIIEKLFKLHKTEAVRLLMHVIHVQQLQLCGASIAYDVENPFKDMIDFAYIDSYVSSHYVNDIIYRDDNDCKTTAILFAEWLNIQAYRDGPSELKCNVDNFRFKRTTAEMFEFWLTQLPQI